MSGCEYMNSGNGKLTTVQNSYTNKIVLITGGTSGIGKAF
jgi:FlaA1/EpsC-like NDP-sugar epimerase